MATELKSWSGLKLNIEAWWKAQEGQAIKGVLLQRNRNPGGRVNTPFYVLQLTEVNSDLQMKGQDMKCEKGVQVAVPENSGLQGLDELLGCEVQIKVLKVRQWETDDGELRDIKEYDVKHGDVVNQAAASRFRPGRELR